MNPERSCDIVREYSHLIDVNTKSNEQKINVYMPAIAYWNFFVPRFRAGAVDVVTLSRVAPRIVSPHKLKFCNLLNLKI